MNITHTHYYFTTTFDTMLLDFFLQVDDIKGECQDAHHKDQIDAYGYTWQLANVAAPGGGTNRGGGKTQFGDLILTKKVDAASIPLTIVASSGKHLKKVRLEVCRAGIPNDVLYTITLTDVLISAISQSGHAGDNTLAETLSFNYSIIEWVYYTKDAKGATEQFSGGFDLRRNTQL
jgi:type VI secretion system secreted protein Hcp